VTAAGPRVQFIHGLEGSPQGAKASALARHFAAVTPAMNTADFAACVTIQADTIASFRPDVLVGSSFGGAVAVELLRRRLWQGATLLLAQAALAMRERETVELPRDVPVWLVHGLNDDVVPIEHSRRLARSGTPSLVRLIEVDDDHGLHRTLESGRLVELVRELHASHPGPRP
jgi:hypothetical protein